VVQVQECPAPPTVWERVQAEVRVQLEVQALVQERAQGRGLALAAVDMFYCCVRAVYRSHTLVLVVVKMQALVDAVPLAARG